MRSIFTALMLSAVTMSGNAHANMSESAYPFPDQPKSPVVENVVDQDSNQDSAYPNVLIRSNQSRDNIASELATYKQLHLSQPSEYRGS